MSYNDGQTTSSVQRRLVRARKKRGLILRMTSVMDVFMILLVFLIKNFSTRPELTLLSQNIKLPISTATQYPEIATTIAATQKVILLNGYFVDTLENIISQDELLNNNLYEKLLKEKEKTSLIATYNPEIKFQGRVTIQADKQIPYKVIKKLIYTCGQAEFGEVSLHVLKKEM